MMFTSNVRRDLSLENELQPQSHKRGPRSHIFMENAEAKLPLIIIQQLLLERFTSITSTSQYIIRCQPEHQE